MNSLRINSVLILSMFFFIACGNQAAETEETQINTESTTDQPTGKTELVLASDIEWEPLNPARGDQSPKAGTLWGDRNGTAPTGFLVEFKEGFSSPAHIHNVTYKGVVISGLIHNDDPDAANMWMPAGSFWTQPAGEGHITAAKGSKNLAFIEIEEGPYLVLPTEEAFDRGERPVNIDETNIVWLDASNATWIEQTSTTGSTNGAKIAYLWGDPQGDQLSGTLVKLPAGFSGEIRSNNATLKAVVIQGQPQYYLAGETDGKTLEPGSYFSSEGQSAHRITSSAGAESIIYVRAEGAFEIITGK